MASNPYMASHFGRSLDFQPNSSGIEEPEDDFDGSLGYSRFTSAKHLTVRVFKPSTAKAEPKQEAPRTPPDNIFKLRDRYLNTNFPSRPATPGSSISSAGRPPLLPPSMNAASRSPRPANSLNTTTTSRSSQARENEVNWPPQATRKAEVTETADSHPDARGRKQSASRAKEKRGEDDDGTNHTSFMSRQWAPQSSPTSVSATACLALVVAELQAERELAESEAVVELEAGPTGGESSAPDVSPFSASPAAEVVSCPESDVSGDHGPQGASEADSAPLAGGLAAILKRSREALQQAQELLGGDADGDSQLAARAPARAMLTAPPPLPLVEPPPSESRRGSIEGPSAEYGAGTSSHQPVSPLADDDFAHFFSPASDIYPMAYPTPDELARQGVGTRERTLVPVGGWHGTAAEVPEGSGQRGVIATLCSVPSQQAKRSLMRREAAPGANGGGTPAASYSVAHIAEGLRHLAAVGGGRRDQRPRGRSSSQHRRHRQDRSSSSHGNGGATAIAPGDVQALLSQLSGLLQAGAATAETHGPSAAAHRHSATRPFTAVPSPVVLAGRLPPSAAHRRRSGARNSSLQGLTRTLSPGGPPSYAQPTESWLHKNVEDADAEWV